jgi:hypothetical protein
MMLAWFQKLLDKLFGGVGELDPPQTKPEPIHLHNPATNGSYCGSEGMFSSSPDVATCKRCLIDRIRTTPVTASDLKRTQKKYDECSDREAELVSRRMCPDCLCPLSEGPCGGGSINVYCLGPHCGSRFNDMGCGAERITDYKPLGRRGVEKPCEEYCKKVPPLDNGWYRCNNCGYPGK